MSSREERQQQQLEQNRQAAEEAQRSEHMPGGGINQPQYQAPRGGPTWDPRWIELFKASNPNAVFDDRGNLIYNDADLGSAEVEAARAVRGLPPSYKTGGDVSPTYAASVYKESRRTASAARSKLEDLNAARTNTQTNLETARQKLAEAKQQQNVLLSGGGDPAIRGPQAANLSSTIRANEMAVANYEAQLKSIDSARSQVANVERQAKIETVKSAFALSSDRTTSGPVDTARISGMGTYQPLGAEGAEPQRQRKQVTSGVKEKLYANPTFMQDAENYTRPPAFLGDVRKERPKIQQGVESKLFINPTYVTKQEQREIDKTKRSAFGISLVETIGTERGPQTFAISLNEGAPSKPRELTQDEVNNLTPQQYAVYRAEIDAYNKYIEDYNKQQKELFRQSKQQNLLQWKQSKSELLTDIAELKKKGVTTISAMTSEGPKDIPINNAFKALTSGKYGGATITGLGIAPTIPEGFTVTRLTGLSNQTLVPGKELITQAQKDEEAKIRKAQIENDPTGLSKFIYKEEQLAQGIGGGKYGPVDPNSWVRSGSYYYAGLASGVGGLFNLAKLGSESTLGLIGGERLRLATQIGVPEIYEPKTKDPYKLGFDAPLTAAQVAIQEGNATQFPVVLNQEAQKAFKVAQGAPIGAIVGQGAAFFVTMGAPVPTRALRAIPFRYTKLPLYTAEGLVESQRTFSAGYDKTLKSLIGKYGPAGEGKFFFGKANPVKAGAENIAAPIGGSSFDRFQPSNLNQAQRTLLKPLIQYGEKTGLTKPGFSQELEPQLIKSQRRELKTPYEYVKQVPNKLLSALPSGQATYNILESTGSAIKQKLLEPAKGSVIQRLLKGGLSRELGDIDLEANTLKKAEKASKKIVKTDVRETIAQTNEPIGLTLYHGTNPTNAQRILKQGLSFEKSRTSESTVFASTDTRGAYGMSGVTLEIKMRQSAKILDVNKAGMAQWEDARIREYARKNKYDLIKNLMQGQQMYGEEVEIVSSKNILSIRPTKSSIPKTIYDVPTGRYIKNNIRTISGEWVNPDTKTISKPISSSRLILERQGYNIAIGEIDYSKPTFSELELPKNRFYKSDITIAHGTTRKSAVEIMKEGADPFQRPYGEPAFFGTTSKDILKTFASERVVLGRVPKSDILFYKDIPKRERLQILKKARQEARTTGKPEWMTHQETVSEYARAKGFKGVTKPYHTTNPASPKFEYIIFEKDVFKPTKIIKPTGYEIKEGTGTKIINIVSPDEEIKNVLGVSTERVYDLKYPTKKIKFSIPESKEKFYTKTMQYQTRAKTASITGIETRESLLAEGMSVEDVNRIMGSSKYVFAPKGRRLQKDIMDRYMGEREAARVEFQAGNRGKALEAAKTMVSIQKYYGPMIKDFGAAIREYKPSVSFEEAVPKKPTSEKILSGSNTVAPKALRVSSPLVSTRQERESPYIRSAYSGSARLGSVKIESPRSALSARSSRSALSSGSIKSGGLSGSVKTITSSSAKTSPAELSAKSGLSRSGFSGKSGLSARPSPSGKSTFGPSPKSVFSPSPRSSSVSPLSVTTPSPLSPKILPIKTLKPLNYPVPKPLALKVPFLKNRTKKEKTTTKGTEEFFGSTHIASVLGFRSKKKDIDYGKDLSGAATKDVKSTDPIRRSAMTKGKTRSMLAQPKRYFTPTKKQSNKFLRL